MSIHSLKAWKQMQQEGARLGRAALAERVFTLVDEFNENRTYKNAIVLAGKLKAISQACSADSYWSEKCSMGFEHERHDLCDVQKTGTLPGGRKSWWIK